MVEVTCYVCNSNVEKNNYAKIDKDRSEIGVVYANMYITIGFENNKPICNDCINEILSNMDRITETDKYSLTTKIDTYKKLLDIKDHVELYDTIRTDYVKLKRLKYIMDRV